MTINIKQLRELLKDKLEEGFSSKDFIFRKSDTSFKKVSDKCVIECLFFLYDYFPSKVEYSFSFTFLIKELEKELKRFFEFSSIVYRKGKGFYISEGDFHPLVVNEPRKFRLAFTHIITDSTQANATIEDTRKILQNEFFSRIEIFSNLENFQKFIIEDFSRVIKYEIVLYSLLALKLHDKGKAFSLAEYISNELKINLMSPDHERRKLIENFFLYIK